jgi:hypothetical protein
MKVPMTLGFEDGWREQIQTTGSGEAWIFQDGVVRGVIWSKAGRGEQLKFTDGAGADVPLARGQTWITAVPSDTGGVSWQ